MSMEDPFSQIQLHIHMCNTVCVNVCAYVYLYICVCMFSSSPSCFNRYLGICFIKHHVTLMGQSLADLINELYLSLLVSQPQGICFVAQTIIIAAVTLSCPYFLYACVLKVFYILFVHLSATTGVVLVN